MKRAKVSKGKKKVNDEVGEVLQVDKTNNLMSLNKPTRITDLNKSKYLSPCRSVGLTKKRKNCFVTQNSGEIVKLETPINYDEDLAVDIGKENTNANSLTHTEKNISIQDQKNHINYENHLNEIKKPCKISSKLEIKIDSANVTLTKPIKNVCLEENFENFFEATKNIVSNADVLLDCTYKTTEEQKNLSNSEFQDCKISSLGKSRKVLADAIKEIELSKNLCKIEKKNKQTDDIDSEKKHKLDEHDLKLTSTCIEAINKRLSKRKSKVKIPIFDMTDPDFEDVSLSKMAKLDNASRSKSVVDTKTADLNIRKSPRKKTSNISRSKSSTSAKLRKSTSGISAPKRMNSNKSEPHSIDSHDCDDDDDFEKKKPIEKKTCTTSKTINEIEVRIERMRNQIMEVKSSSRVENESELEMLIVKWRTGCQEALHELLKVTREQMPGSENIQMDNLLTMLNLPADLVKYNSDQCCFE